MSFHRSHLPLGYHAGIERFWRYFRRLEDYGFDHVIVSFQADEPQRALTTFVDEINDELGICDTGLV